MSVKHIRITVNELDKRRKTVKDTVLRPILYDNRTQQIVFSTTTIKQY